MRQFISTGLISLMALAITPTAFGNTSTLTDWEVHAGDGVIALDEAIFRFGAKRLYPLSEIPELDDDGWRLAPDYARINLDEMSSLCHTETTCFDAVDFTYFQTFLTLPLDASPSTVTLGFDALDDGVQVTVFNRRHPEGTDAKGTTLFKKLEFQETANFSHLLVAGENRIVITLLDNCCGRSVLEGAQLIINDEPVVDFSD